MVRELRTPPTVESAPVSVLVLPTCNGSSCYKDEYLSFRFISSIIRVIMHVGRFLRTYVPAAVVTLLAVATVGCGSLYLGFRQPTLHHRHRSLSDVMDAARCPAECGPGIRR